jgi:peptidyl-prolyl cis-trans isomerase A (cyclophilin A)
MRRKALVRLGGVTLACLLSWSCAGGGKDEEPADQEPVRSSDTVLDEPNPALLVPGLAHEKAPQSFQVEFETTKGFFVVQVEREWAPRGADRLFNLTKIGFFEDVAFFRAIEGFVVQFGVSGDPEINREWSIARIKDDPVKTSNKRGYLTFAMAGPNSRTTQLFISLRDNSDLDSQGFAPIGRVITGISVVESLHTGYGELAPRGKGPRPKVLNARGNQYLKMQFPELDYIKRARILE